MRATSLAVTLLAASAVGAACGGRGDRGDSGPDRPRGASIVVTRSAVAGFAPAESITGVASFFAPPGPEPGHWPADGACEWSTPVPAGSATPAPTPSATPDAVGWRDAGASVVLRSEATALRLDRFEGPAGEILYLTRADALPETFPTAATYAVEIAGSDAPDGVAEITLPGAVVAPAAVGLYAPDFALAPIALSRDTLQLGWTPGDADEAVRVRVVISGSAGSVTLTCGTSDNGFFQLAASTMEQFPSGGGTITVSRRGVRATKLPGDTWLDAEAVFTEGGTVLLP